MPDTIHQFRRTPTWCASILAMTLAACSGSTEPLTPCSGAITPHVDTGTQPRFTWSPRCGVAEIEVMAPPSNGGTTEMWHLVGDGGLIGPGVRYGGQPSGTRTDTPATPVTRGTDYAVFFTVQSPHSVVGSLSWTP